MEDKQRSRVEADEITFFASYYETQKYNPTGWRLRLERELKSLLRAAHGKRLKRVLSLGCGDGQFELMLAPHVDNVTGLDISPEAIALARQMADKAGVRNVDFRCQALSELDWSETYDCVVCLGFLHHVPEAELPALFRQSRDHLADGGFFYAQDPNVHGVMRSIGRLVMKKEEYDRFHSPDERELDPGEIRDHLTKTGFSTVHIGYIDLTLIPALFVLAKGPTWPLYVCTVVDWIWCRIPVLRRWASGFTSIARK